jgi:hypothetical protein
MIATQLFKVPRQYRKTLAVSEVEATKCTARYRELRSNEDMSLLRKMHDQLNIIKNCVVNCNCSGTFRQRVRRKGMVCTKDSIGSLKNFPSVELPLTLCKL